MITKHTTCNAAIEYINSSKMIAVHWIFKLTCDIQRLNIQEVKFIRRMIPKQSIRVQIQKSAVTKIILYIRAVVLTQIQFLYR